MVDVLIVIEWVEFRMIIIGWDIHQRHSSPRPIPLHPYPGISPVVHVADDRWCLVSSSSLDVVRMLRMKISTRKPTVVTASIVIWVSLQLIYIKHGTWRRRLIPIQMNLGKTVLFAVVRLDMGLPDWLFLDGNLQVHCLSAARDPLNFIFPLKTIWRCLGIGFRKNMWNLGSICFVIFFRNIYFLRNFKLIF